jgi:hypothetical protein
MTKATAAETALYHLKRLRRERGVSQRQLPGLFNQHLPEDGKKWGYGTVTGIEGRGGDRRPRALKLDELVVLAKAFKVDVSTFLEPETVFRKRIRKEQAEAGAKAERQREEAQDAAVRRRLRDIESTRRETERASRERSGTYLAPGGPTERFVPKRKNHGEH